MMNPSIRIERRALGLCTRCGEKIDTALGWFTCPECRQYFRLYMRKRKVRELNASV